MRETHFEPFVHLVDVTCDAALIAWGGFYFQRADADEPWQVVDDDQLRGIDAGRDSSIGASSQPYGHAVVEALDEAGGVVARTREGSGNHAWLTGLEPDTVYGYRVWVDGEPWAVGPRRDWDYPGCSGLDLVPGGGEYPMRLRTHPAPDQSVGLRFAVLGDFGVGITADTEAGRRQRRIAAVLDRLVAEHGVRLVLTTGDNVYPTLDSGSGAHDAHWYSSFYAPYRYVLASVPVYPSVGNHDSGEEESSDDRAETLDNFYTHTRFAQPAQEGRAVVEPGLNYRFGYGADIEFCSIDTTETPGGLRGEHYFQYPEHDEFLQQAFPEPGGGPRWRIPFFHHPPYCAGPDHGNNQAVIEYLEPLFRRAGVAATFAGHDHNFQVARADGIRHFISGAGGKVNETAPADFAAAGTEAWAMQAHCLLVDITDDHMTVTPVSGLAADGSLQTLSALNPDHAVVRGPFHVPANHVEPQHRGGP